MNKLYKYISIFLFIVLAGVTIVSLNTQSKLKDTIITLQEQVPDTIQVNYTDTIYFTNTEVKWKTKHDTTNNVIIDTFFHNDTITIVKEKISPLDTFSVTQTYQDSIVDATINIEGRGIYQKTFLDSISLQYNVNTEALIPKKPCGWLRRIFCGC